MECGVNALMWKPHHTLYPLQEVLAACSASCMHSCNVYQHRNMFISLSSAVMYVSTARVFFATVCVWLVTSGALLIFRSALTFRANPKVLDLRSSMECSKGLCDGTLSNQKVSESALDWRKDEPSYLGDVTDADHESTDLDQQKKAPLPVQLSQHTTMVKLGTDLKLNVSHHCPAGSFMLRTNQHFSPKHSNCPTLYIVGARKAGTSSLYQYVSKHPDFQGIKLDAGVQAGEAFYYQKLKLGSWKHYISLFPTTRKMTGESSVAYLVGSLVPRRLYEMCGKQAKVVVLLRDPIKRLESNFLMRVKYQIKSRNRSISPVVKQDLGSYLKAVKKTKATDMLQEWSKLVGLYPPAKNMVFEGLYYVHLLNWLCNFPAENILIINSEEFYRNSSTILDLVFQFLGLKRLDAETYDWITSATYNKGNYDVPTYQKLSDAHIEKLLGVYGPFNKALLELLHWENHQWLTQWS